MLTRDLMTKEIGYCLLEDTAAKAGEIMTRYNCGFVPIVRDESSLFLEGVVTDRDIALYLTKTDQKASEVRLSEFYSRNPKKVFPDDDIKKIKALLEESQIHRIPVTERDGKLLGVVSLKDLAAEAWKERSLKTPQFTEKEVAEIVETISVSR